MYYRLIRQEDGLTKESKDIKWIEFDEVRVKQVVEKPSYHTEDTSKLEAELVEIMLSDGKLVAQPMTEEGIDEFFESNTKEELQTKWKKYDKYSNRTPKSKLDLNKMEQDLDKVLDKDVPFKTAKEQYMEKYGKEDSVSIKKARNRVKYRKRLRVYKKLWFYALVFIDYIKDRIYYYENKGIEK